MSHRHYCDVVGHDWQCSSADCECVCDFLMEEGDHSDCPVELRACPEHENQAGRQMSEVNSDAVEIDFSILSPERQQASPHCECGCAEIDVMEIVGWCLWCSHVYSEWNPVIQDGHFAHQCSGVPGQGRLDALESLAKRKP
jgi:hypothetical protein